MTNIQFTLIENEADDLLALPTGSGEGIRELEAEELAAVGLGDSYDTWKINCLG